jgi:hypothetical protein
MPDLRPHPDEVTTAAYLDGALVERERDRFESHLAGCDVCREGVVLLRVGDDEPAAAPAEWVARARAVGSRTSHSTPRIPAWAAAAAAAILLAGALALHVPAPSAASRTFRSEPEPALAPLYPATGSRVVAGGLRFRWSPVPGADRYRVTLRTTTGETLGRVEVPASQPELAWTGAALPSGTLLWSVEALSLDRVIAASRPTPFAVR